MSWYRETAMLSLLLTVCIVLFFLKEEIQTSSYSEEPDYQHDLLQIKILHDQNLELEDNLLSLESYTYIASQAARKGLTLTGSPCNCIK